MINRRAVLCGSLAWSSPLLAGFPGPDAPPRPPDPERPGTGLDRIFGSISPWLDLTCPHTGEDWQGWFTGPGRRAALDELEWFLRDWHENVCAAICTRLYWALAVASHRSRLQGRSGRVHVLSGYRTPRTNSSLAGAARNSFHIFGRAVDVRIEGFTTDDLAGYMRRLEVGGVGRYPVGAFVHLDSGPVRIWAGSG